MLKFQFFYVFYFNLAAPSPPQNVRTSRIVGETVYLEWKPPASDGGARVTQYHIYKTIEDDINFKKIQTLDAYQTSTDVKKVQCAIPFLFAVSAENDIGESELTQISEPVVIPKPVGKMTHDFFCCFLCLIMGFLFVCFFFFSEWKYQLLHLAPLYNCEF